MDDRRLTHFVVVWVLGLVSLITIWRIYSTIQRRDLPASPSQLLKRDSSTPVSPSRQLLIHDSSILVQTRRRRRRHTPPPRSTTTGSTTSAQPLSTPTQSSTSPTTSSPATVRPQHVDRYVTFSGGFGDGRGLGNQIFNFATVVYVAELTGRQPAMLKFPYRVSLEEVFDLQIERFDDMCPCYEFGERKSLEYDDRLEELVRSPEMRAKTAGTSILIGGFFQSWKYTRSIERRLRRHLKFQPDLLRYVDEFMRDNVPPNWIRGFVRVGIHVRRGDILTEDKTKFGYTTPDAGYYQRAMNYFTRTYDRVQFIVCTQDVDWSRQNLLRFNGNSSLTNITIVGGRSHGEDLALLAACDHVIMSTGTYGWWASWLAKGTTIYYADWPRNGTALWNMFRREDFFPPNWIAMT